jgi:hypothetical protein
MSSRRRLSARFGPVTKQPESMSIHHFIRRARTLDWLMAARCCAERCGLDKLTQADVDVEVAAYRCRNAGADDPKGR